MVEEARRRDLTRFYALLERAAGVVGGTRTLAAGNPGPERTHAGVYFFYDVDELRSDSGNGPRVVRVGTHAVSRGSRATLWRRLKQHRGSIRSGAGNHRGSVFRKLVGAALQARGSASEAPAWGRPSPIAKEVRAAELPVERLVSARIRQLPYVWIRIEDAAGPRSRRAYVERNAIALLSNFERPALDPPSATWLGRDSDRERVRRSGLWNSDHVDREHDAGFLDVLTTLI